MIGEKISHVEVNLCEVCKECASKMFVTLSDGFIAECSFTGGCPGDLKILTCNLLGEHVMDAPAIVMHNCCIKTQRPCARKLREQLSFWFKKIWEDYK